MAGSNRRKPGIENMPGISIALGERDSLTVVDISNLPDKKYIIETMQIIDELQSNGLGRWVGQPKEFLDKDPESGEECSRLLFAQTGFGSLRNTHAESAAHVLTELLELDKVPVALDEEVKDLTPPIEPAAE